MIDNKCYLLNNKKKYRSTATINMFHSFGSRTILLRISKEDSILWKDRVYFLLVQCKNIHKKYLEFYEQTLTKQGNLNSLQQFITRT